MNKPPLGESFDPINPKPLEVDDKAAEISAALKAAKIAKRLARKEEHAPDQADKEARRRAHADNMARGAANRAAKTTESALPASGESVHSASSEAAGAEEAPKGTERVDVEGGENPEHEIEVEGRDSRSDSKGDMQTGTESVELPTTPKKKTGFKNKSNFKKHMSTDATAEGFSMDEALNTKGFAEFLARAYKGSAETSIEDEEWVKPRFEAFQHKDRLVEEFTSNLGVTLAAEIGLTLDKGDVESIQEAVDDSVAENPELVTGTIRAFAETEALQKAIASDEKKIADSKEGLAKLKKEKADLELGTDHSTAFNGIGRLIEKGLGKFNIESRKSHKAYQDFKKMSDLYKLNTRGAMVDRLREITEKINQGEEFVAEYEKSRDEQTLKANELIAAARMELFTNLSTQTELSDLISKKIQKQVEGAVSRARSVKDLSAVKTVIGNIEAKGGEDIVGGIDTNKITEQLNAATERVARDLLSQSMSKINFKKDGVLSGLEASISEVSAYMDSDDETSEKFDEIIEKMIEDLQDESSKLNKDNTGEVQANNRAKSLILKRILIKRSSAN